MSKAVYVGVNTDVPIYKDTVKELWLSSENIASYFAVEPYPDGIVYSESTTNGVDGLRFGAGNIKVNNTTGGGKFTAIRDLKNVKVWCEYNTEKYDTVTTIVAGTTVMDGVGGSDNTALNLIWSGNLSAGQVIDCKFTKDPSMGEYAEKVNWEITCDPITINASEIIGYENKDVGRAVKKMYIGVNGVARKVKKAYIGVNGVARQFYSE